MFLLWFLLFYVLVLIFVLFAPYGRFHILVVVNFRLLSGRLLGNGCSLGLQYVFLVQVSGFQISFFPPRFLEWEFLSDCAFS